MQTSLWYNVLQSHICRHRQHAHIVHSLSKDLTEEGLCKRCLTFGFGAMQLAEVREFLLDIVDAATCTSQNALAHRVSVYVHF